jgi:hypothetical protein
MSELTFPAFLEAIERGDAPVVKEGYRRLVQEFRQISYPVFSQARQDRSEDALQQLVQEFVVYLTTTREGKNSAAVLTNWKGARLQAIRWARRVHRRERSIEDKSSIFRELLYKKVGALLRGAPFERVAFRYRIAGQPEVPGLDDDALRRELPPIQALLDSPREDQSPQVAPREEVHAQLRRILELGGNRLRLLIELHDLVWSSLVPTPGTLKRRVEQEPLQYQPKEPGRAFLIDQCPSQAPSPLDQIAISRGQLRLDQEAHAFLSSVEERVRRSVRLYRGLPEGPARTLEEVGRILGVSKSTVENDNKTFRERFTRWVEVRRLDDDEVQPLMKRVLALLSAEESSRPEGESAS